MWRKIFMIFLAVSCGQRLTAQDSAMNDHIFSAAVPARSFINFDQRGFLVKGKRTFIVSAGIEYARIPRALWKDRLLRLKRAGFNTVEIYTFWNFHEPKEGQFNFSGDHDLGYFLRLVHEMGMYCIARVGPYYCAEWDQGGYPLWLRFKPGLRVREPNEPFEKYVGRFFDRLLPIIRENQIHRGGSVIMVQLENEHIKGWGTVMPNRYFKFLQQKALNAGIEVPYFFSGLHHDTDPVGDQMNLDDSTRPNPWMSTEFWSVWFNQYGAAPGDADKYERFTRKIIARGGNGYNYYMAHGGSNFGYTNNDEDAASYDYGAAVGQGGDLRPLYYRMKRCAYFANSFAGILENSHMTESRLHTDTSLRITERSGPAGNLLFIDNPGKDAISITHNLPETEMQFPNSTLTIAPGEIVPVVNHFNLTKNTEITWSSARILGLLQQGDTHTMICYGEPGSDGGVYFTSLSGFQPQGQSKKMTVPTGNPKGLMIRTVFTVNPVPEEFQFRTDGETVRIFFVSTALADRTWFLESNGQKYIVCGPQYPAEFSAAGGQYRLNTEDPLLRPDSDSVKYPLIVYAATGAVSLSQKRQPIGEGGDIMLPLSDWNRTGAGAPASVEYDDSRWTASDNPLQMGIDGNPAPEAWYRTAIDIRETGTYKLECSGGDRLSVFLDGKWMFSDTIYKGEFLLPVSAGRHRLAIYTAHDGRDKLPGYIGPLDSVNTKGLNGEVWLKRDTAQSPQITRWRFIKSKSAGDAQKPVPTVTAGWQEYKTGEDAFDKKTGYGWFESRIAKPLLPVSRMELLFKSVDEDATVFVDGKKLAVHKGWNQPFRVSVTVSGETQWPLKLDVFIENHSNEGGIDQPVSVNSFGPGDQLLQHWRMTGGTPMDDSAARVIRFRKTDAALADTGALANKAGGIPVFYSAHFILADTNTGDVWRVHPDGLDHGYIWVNGHNLGHYPEKIASPGLYIPGNWLKKGDNELKILDETGASPARVTIGLEKEASRILKQYQGSVAVKSTLKTGHAK